MDINIKRVKIFVTIPLDSVEKVREAVCNAGAGIIGERNKNITLKTLIQISRGFNMSLIEFLSDDLFTREDLEIY